RRMASAQAVLEGCRTRDAAIEALIRAVMIISPRAALFRIKDDKLIGLSTPRTGIGDITDKEVKVRPGTKLATAIAAGQWSGKTPDAALQAVLGLAGPIPCVLGRIDVVGRPVMLLYVDHSGGD